MTMVRPLNRVVATSTVLLGVLVLGCAASRQNEPDFTFGFTPPTEATASFADGFFVKDARPHGAMILHPNGTEAWWSVHDIRGGEWAQAVHRSRLVDGAFTEPERVTFGHDASTGSPVLSADGNRIYFVSTRPVDGETIGYKRVWYCDRTASGWTEAKPIKGQVSEGDIGNLIGLSGRNTLLFARLEKQPSGPNNSKLYRATIIDGKSSDVQIFPDEINALSIVADPWFDPGEQFILFMGVVDRVDDNTTHLYVSFRHGDGWTRAKKIDAVMRPGSSERFPSVTPDGRWLIFVQETRTKEGTLQSEYRWAPVSVLAASNGTRQVSVHKRGSRGL